MRIPRLALLAALFLGCHFDKLFNASGGGGAASVLGNPTGLVFTTQPASTGQDSIITPPVQVSAVDSDGNVVAGFSGNVTVELGRNGSLLGNAQLVGVTTVQASGGVATFSALSINEAGTGYTLKAELVKGTSLKESAAFDVRPAVLPGPAGTERPPQVTASTTRAE